MIEEQDRDEVDSLNANRQDLGFIEAEKMRRRVKRLKEEREKEESRHDQLSPLSPHSMEDTVMPNIVWEEGEEERLEQEMLEECLDCTREYHMFTALFAKCVSTFTFTGAGFTSARRTSSIDEQSKGTFIAIFVFMTFKLNMC